jgi:hypothetical protein
MLKIYENFFRLDFAMHSFEKSLELDAINLDSLFDDNSLLSAFFTAFVNLLSDYGEKYEFFFLKVYYLSIK